MFELREVSFRIRKAILLERVSLRLEPGELLAVIGPNGAGKSTALRLLGGEHRPSEGIVRMDGRDIGQMPPLEQARRRAVVTQRAELNFDMPVLDVVLLGRHPFNGGQARRMDRKIAEHCLAEVGLGGFRDRGYLSLSGGERQRVQIARSLAQLAGSGSGSEPNPSASDSEAPAVPGAFPRYWLLDEPTSALDLAHQHRLLGLCRRRAEDGGTAVLVVLHDLNLALRYAHRIVLMHRGRVHAEGQPEQVLTPENLAQVYGVRARLCDLEPEGTRQLVVC